MAEEPQEGGGAGTTTADLPPPAPPSKKAPAEEEEPPGAPEWVVTFTDMISLLVTFFVLLMTFSSMEEHDLLRVQGLVQGNRGVVQNVNGMRIVEQPPIDQISNTDPLDGAPEPHVRPPDQLDDDIADLAKREEPDQLEIDLTKIQDGLLVEWDQAAGFAPGSARPNRQLTAELSQTAEVLSHYPHLVVVEGHTDNAFAGDTRHADPQALSLARSVAAARLLIEAGVQPGRIQIAGYGAERPRSLNDTPAGRAANRRVGLRVLTLPRHRATQLELERGAARQR